MLSLQRQITPSIVLTTSYVGNQGHHLLVLLPTNVGNATAVPEPGPARRRSLPEVPLCGPYGEDSTYTSASAALLYTSAIHETLWPGRDSERLYGEYGAVTAQRTIGNSNFNALETNLRYAGKRWTFLFAYTYSKSIDQASNIGELINPFNRRLSRAISSWDMRHNFVATYSYDLPFDRLLGRSNQLTQGWSISGTTRFASGFPVTLFDDSDNSLLGTLGNGVNNNLLDTPQFTPGPLAINTNPRNGRPEFNSTRFRRSRGASSEIRRAGSL